MLLEVVLSNETLDGLHVVCAACKRNLSNNGVAAFVRAGPHEDFIAWCPYCMELVCRAAERTMAIDEALDQLFK